MLFRSGDKRNTPFFEEHLPKVYARRASTGLDQLVGSMAGLVIQVDHGHAVPYLAELTLMGPYRYRECWLLDTHRVYLLAADPAWPRLIVLEPLTSTYEDEATRWNAMYPLSADCPNARYVGEVYHCVSTSEVRKVLEGQNIRFLYPGETPNPFYAQPNLTFTFLSEIGRAHV